MSAAEHASKESSAEHENEWAVRGNEWTEERMTQWSTRPFYSHSTHSGMARPTDRRMDQHTNRPAYWRANGRMDKKTLKECDLNKPVFQTDLTLFKGHPGGLGAFLMENLFGEMSWIGPGHHWLIYEIRTYSMISMFIFHVFNLPESTHCPCFLALRTLMEARKKIHFRSLDLGEWDHADSTEPPFQRPIFFRLTLPNPRGDFKNTPRGFPDRKPLSICIVDRSRPPKTHLCKKS